MACEWKYFDPNKRIDRHAKNLDHRLMRMLDEARGIANTPFIITSGKRKKSTNKKVGGVKNSSHVKGIAADIRCHFSRQRFAMVSSLLKVGFNRIGIYDRHIHVDIDHGNRKDVNVIWVGKSK